MLPNLTYTACLSVCVCVCVHACVTFFHYYRTCSSKAIHSIRNTTPPSSAPCACVCVCVWLRLSASAHSPLIAGLTVTTLLHTSGLYTEGRRIGENTGAGTQLTYRAIDNLPPLHQNIGEGREEGGRERRKRGRRRRRGKKRKKIQRILVLQM